MSRRRQPASLATSSCPSQGALWLQAEWRVATSRWCRKYRQRGAVARAPSLALALARRRIAAVAAFLLAKPKGPAQLLQAQRVVGQLLIRVALVHERQLRQQGRLGGEISGQRQQQRRRQWQL